ncbi:hypothetical protein BD769DRAFT_1653122 [Suillus cothurnatus]|nr:hypothetical protein BD769DRAFT_1653122 [Suillus cothurnatus]
MTLLPLAILLLLHIPFVCSSLPSLNGTSVTTLDVSDPPSCDNTRSLWEIIWSCVATLFACTWTAIHPNIPGMDEGKFAVLSRRLGIMIVALIAPELIITWAASQFLSARDTAKDFNDAFGAQLHQARSDCGDMGESAATLLSEISTKDRANSPHSSALHVASRDVREWTVTHGFFAWMGGFMLYVNGKPRATLKPYELIRFIREGSVEMPVIVEADIEDRSKGDALSKGIVILQLAWFILQLVSRYIQNLPITLLEFNTLALATLTGIAYGLWWKKPKDVKRPYAVYWKGTVPPSELAYEHVHVKSPTESWGDFLTNCVYPFVSLMGWETQNSSRAVHSRRVSSVGGYDEIYVPLRHSLIVCLGGAAFGGIHCLGWNVLFRGHAEQILWRAASLAIVSAPLSVSLVWGYLSWLNSFDNVSRIFVVSGILAVCGIPFASIFIYIVARVTLIVLILLSFQSLPPWHI